MLQDFGKRKISSHEKHLCPKRNKEELAKRRLLAEMINSDKDTENNCSEDSTAIELESYMYVVESEKVTIMVTNRDIENNRREEDSMSEVLEHIYM